MSPKRARISSLVDCLDELAVKQQSAAVNFARFQEKGAKLRGASKAKILRMEKTADTLQNYLITGVGVMDSVHTVIEDFVSITDDVSEITEDAREVQNHWPPALPGWLDTTKEDVESTILEDTESMMSD